MAKKKKKKDKKIKFNKIVTGLKRYTTLSMIKSNLIIESVAGERLPLRFINSKSVYDELSYDKKTIIVVKVPKGHKLLVTHGLEKKEVESIATLENDGSTFYSIKLNIFLDFVRETLIKTREGANYVPNEKSTYLVFTNEKNKEVDFFSIIHDEPEIFGSDEKGKERGIVLLINM